MNDSTLNESVLTDVANELDPMLHPLTPAEQAAADVRATAARKSREMRDAAADGLSEVKNFTENAMETVRENYEEIKAKGVVYVKDNPTRAAMIALGIGFVIGLITR